jgi:hypothetical protein
MSLPRFLAGRRVSRGDGPDGRFSDKGARRASESALT